MEQLIDKISTFSTRVLSADELDTELIQKWDQLESQSQQANPFLSPGFVLPFLKNRDSTREAVFLICENKQDQRLIGLGIFEHVGATRLLPMPHLIPFRCNYALRCGLLVAKGAESNFIDSLLHFMSQQQQWAGIEFVNFPMKQNWVKELQKRANRFSCSFQMASCFESPSVNLAQLDEKGLSGTWSSSRRKTMRKNLNRLRRHGEVDFRMVDSGPELLEALERFLILEHSGWKKQMGTSILSSEEDTEFVHEMVSEFAARKKVLISELRVGEKIAASAINLLSGDKLFAFKIGYDKDYAQASPGSLHEAKLIEYLQQSYPQIMQIDGCAKPDSYLEKIWPDRISIANGLLTVSPTARIAGKLMTQLRLTKRSVFGFLEA